MYTIKSLIFWHFGPIFGSFWVSMGSLKASQGPLLFSKTVFQHTMIVSLPKILKIGCLQNISPKNQLFWAFQLHFGQFLDIYGAPTGQLRAPFFSMMVFQHTIIFFLPKIQRIGCLLDIFLKNYLFCADFSHIRGPYRPAKGPLYFQRLYFNIQLYFY